MTVRSLRSRLRPAAAAVRRPRSPAARLRLRSPAARLRLLLAAAAPAGAPGAAGAPPERDEINEYIDGRYCSASEAVWRISGFGMHSRAPTVARLAVHLPGEHAVVFNLNHPDRPIPRTTLTAWLRFNADHTRDPNHWCHTTLYHNMPQHAVWDLRAKAWRQRVRPVAGAALPVGRVYYASPSAGERFFLRLLLAHVPGATSYEHLRTTGRSTPAETLHPTYKDACLARGAAGRF